MGFSFRKSMKIGKNTRINLSKSGVGLSTGLKGARVSINRKGIRTQVGANGLYYRKDYSIKNNQEIKDITSGKTKFKPSEKVSNAIKTHIVMTISLYICLLLGFAFHILFFVSGMLAMCIFLSKNGRQRMYIYTAVKRLKALDTDKARLYLGFAKYLDDNELVLELEQDIINVENILMNMD